jgi:ferredoxin
MPYVITPLCTNDGACVEVCPVACIHTTPGAPQFYIDPEVCIDCEQCEIVCPVDAIFKDIDIPPEHAPSIEVNAAFFRQNKAAIVGLAVSAVVVDEAGAPIAVGRMDKAEANSVELAFNKAYTAAAFHMATTELAPQAREPWMRSLTISHRGRMLAMGGAVPILNGVTIVGAIGVAGASRPEQDVLCCRAAMAVWETPGHH